MIWKIIGLKIYSCTADIFYGTELRPPPGNGFDILYCRCYCYCILIFTSYILIYIYLILIENTYPNDDDETILLPTTYIYILDGWNVCPCKHLKTIIESESTNPDNTYASEDADESKGRIIIG